MDDPAIAAATGSNATSTSSTEAPTSDKTTVPAQITTSHGAHSRPPPFSAMTALSAMSGSHSLGRLPSAQQQQQHHHHHHHQQQLQLPLHSAHHEHEHSHPHDSHHSHYQHQHQPEADPAPPHFHEAVHGLPFVQPSSYLRPKPSHQFFPTDAPSPMSPIDEEQMQGLKGLREFLRVRTSYDVLPLSFRLIVLDNHLLIRKSLNILIHNGIVSAPLWDSNASRFSGLLTSTDFLNLIQYYCQFPEAVDDNVEKFRLSSLRDIERAIGVSPLETISVNPGRPLYEACSRMLKSRARRIPLVDTDSETGRETIVSVITQYRILKFIAVNTEQHTMLMKKTLREIGLGTYSNLVTAKMSDQVLDVINLMVTHNISAVPIIDRNNVVLNVFEAVDVIPCIKEGDYDELKANVGEVLLKRSEDFQGIYTCQEDDRLDSLFTTIRQSRVHRLVVIDDQWQLKGMISLSDILNYVLFHGEEKQSEYFFNA